MTQESSETGLVGHAPPRILIIGAGSRGNAYAKAIQSSTKATIIGVAEPSAFKRKQFGVTHVWGDNRPEEGQEFEGWEQYVQWEWQRRTKAAAGSEVPEGADGVFVCTLDETHAEIITGLAPLHLHIMSEKPLATTLQACLDIYAALGSPREGSSPSAIFAIGHVLRYSPHNMLLRELLLDGAIGDVISVEQTEPIGWWHFCHSYVRGNWRKESTTAPSLLTKSCHDIDLLLWLLSSPRLGGNEPPHLPSSVYSTGSLVHFKPSRKPVEAGDATNCLSCVAEPNCLYSARKIYQRALTEGTTGWPVKIVLPEIEECIKEGGMEAAEGKLLEKLEEDYRSDLPAEEIEARPWFGRCVYDAGNDVCDDQVVVMTWNDDPIATKTDDSVEIRANAAHDQGRVTRHRGSKTATFHMVAFTESICERRSRIYGTKGEITADSTTIRVHYFQTRHTTVHHPVQEGGGHGGGDNGLARQFIQAIDAVKNQNWSVDEAQRTFLGCTLEEVIRSHAMVFAAEESRRSKQIIDWPEWWRFVMKGDGLQSSSSQSARSATSPVTNNPRS
ncbi:MAG: hypothetical protein M1833_004938 [Piccolia ochrophora]|nr:MAG: hypothetical protein M1833_004938 [Piccolia ochrophora]